MAPLLRCPHAAQCAGCPLIHLSVDEQLAHKHARVARAVARFPSLAALVVESPRPAAPVGGYRTRAKLVVGPGPALGLYAREGDHVVVDIPECQVQAPAIFAAAAAVRALLKGPPAGAAAVLRAGVLRAVDLREAVDEEGHARVLVTLVVDDAAVVPEVALGAAADALAAAAPEVLSVSVSLQQAGAAQLLGRALRTLRGPTFARDVLPETGVPVPRLWVHATPGGFVQAHRGQTGVLHHLVAASLESALGGLSGRRVVDAYSGSGAMGFALAARGARVVLVESHAASAESARVAADAQGLSGVEIRAGDVEAVLQELGAERRASGVIDAIVANPPRRGVSPAVRASLALLAKTAIVYVSCDPDTLARDLDHLTRLGWVAETLRPLDMIPQTEEVETVAVLARRAPAPLTVLYDREGLVALDKPAHAPASISGATCLFPLDVLASGVCLFARDATAEATWSGRLSGEGASFEYVALCRGIARPRAPDRLLHTAGGHSLLAVRLERGGTRRLRRRLASMGHPILGDDRDGHAPSNRHLLEKHGLDRPFLHCARIALPTPSGPLIIEAPLPGDLVTVLDRLDAHGRAPG